MRNREKEKQIIRNKEREIERRRGKRDGQKVVEL